MDKLLVNGKEHEVDSSGFDGSDRGQITVDGVAREVEILGSTADRLLLSVDGQVVTLFTAAAANGTWVGGQGRARLVTRPSRARRRAGAGADGEGGLVTPTFPAAVVKVLVEPGQELEKGAAVVVVSAMKMEMTLTAPHAGTVKAVNFVQGDQVKPGDQLVEIEPRP